MPDRINFRYLKHLHGLLLVILMTLNSGLVAQDVIYPDVHRFRKKKEISAMSYVHVKSGKIFAVEDIGEARNGSHHYYAGSLGKTIVALGVMRLVEQNVLNLDESVQAYLPQLKLKNEFEQELALRHLLNHTSGFDEMHFRQYYSHTPDAKVEMSDVLPLIEDDLVCRWEPSSAYAYSNLNYAVLGLVLEKVTGESAGKWLKDSVLIPLGMRDSYFEQSKANSKVQLKGTIGGKEVETPQPLIYPAIGFVTTALDLGKLIEMFANDGKIGQSQFLTMAHLEEMAGLSENGKIPERPFRPGFGMEIDDVRDQNVWKGLGGVQGFSGFFKVSPNESMGFGVLLNASMPSGMFLREMEVALDCDFKEAGEVRVPKNAPNRFDGRADLEGYFRFSNPRNSIFKAYDDLFSWYMVKTSISDDGFSLSSDGNPNAISAKHYAMIGYDPILSGGTAFIWHDTDEDGRQFFELEGRKYIQTSWVLPFLGPKVVWTMNWLRWIILGFFGTVLILTMAKQFSWKGLPLTFLLIMLPAWCCDWGFQMLSSENFEALGQFGLYSCTLFFLSCMLPVATIAGTIKLFRTRKGEIGAYLKFILVLQVFGNFILCIFLATYGFLPFASWLY